MRELAAERLRRLYHDEDLSQKEIAERFDLTQPCISKRMKRWGIKSDHKGFWSEKEIELIEEHYPENKSFLKSEMDRTWNAIKLKAMDLGLAKDQEEHRHSEEVAETLRKNAEDKKIDVRFEDVETLSYVLGVVDGDGYTDNKSTVGLEVKYDKFADKFDEKLEDLGLNPGRGTRRGKETVWASSSELVGWIKEMTYLSKIEWLKEEGEPWAYIEGVYDSDGNLSNPGPRICSYDEKEKKFMANLLEFLDMQPSIHTNNVYIPARNKEKFFENLNPVYDRRSP